MEKNHFSLNLKFLREKNSKTQSDIAFHVDKRNTAISSWEKGDSEPQLKDIFKISDYFGVSVNEIITMDLSKGNLISKNKDSVTDKKGNLNSNLKGNLSIEKEEKITYVMPKVITVDFAGNDNIVHVPIRARAGYLLGYGDEQFIETLPTYRLPGLNNGTYRSFEVEGQSMKPTILNRDWVIGEWVEGFHNIRENRVHIIVTRNDGILIKRVLNRIKERNMLYLKSDNYTNRSEYPTIELRPEEVAEIWYGRIKFSSDFSEPSEIYTRLNDLEIDMIELKKQLGK